MFEYKRLFCIHKNIPIFNLHHRKCYKLDLFGYNYHQNGRESIPEILFLSNRFQNLTIAQILIFSCLKCRKKMRVTYLTSMLIEIFLCSLNTNIVLGTSTFRHLAGHSVDIKLLESLQILNHFNRLKSRIIEIIK